MVVERRIAKCFSRHSMRSGYSQAPVNASMEAKIEVADDSKVDQDTFPPGSPTPQWILDSICENINENQENPEDSDDPQEYQDSVPPGSPMSQWLLDEICDSLDIDRESVSGDCHSSSEQQIPADNESEHEISNMTQEEEDSLIFGAISTNPPAVCRGSHGRRVPKISTFCFDDYCLLIGF